MLKNRKFLIVTVVLAALPVMIFAQTRPGVTSSNEMSVEQSYLQESVELMIIREQARTDSRDMKFVALEYIGDAIERGNKSDEIRATLEYLSLEGVLNVARENGRVVNNFPDVRKEAASYLGKLGTPEAKNTLLKMVIVDNEPMVLTEAIRSLGTIGLNEADEVTKVIAWTVSRFNTLNPDNFMALSAIDAFEKIAEANGGLRDRSAMEVLVKIADGPYITPVKEKAKAALSELRGF